ncbi:MAG TPA: hypothetical protein VEH84_03950 [Alphaproteobacteria bacterium]|nr:hypothetical protein [Alphaproteobacteria bacterium]
MTRPLLALALLALLPLGGCTAVGLATSAATTAIGVAGSAVGTAVDIVTYPISSDSE